MHDEPLVHDADCHSVAVISEKETRYAHIASDIYEKKNGLYNTNEEYTLVYKITL